MTDSLKDKTIRGVGWSLIDNFANAGITFLIGLILARLLSPQEYGLMAIVTLFIAISNTIVDSGFSNALIRKLEVKSIDYNTTFSFNFILSIILYIILFYASPIISAFFNEPQLTSLIRVVGIVLIINAVAIIPKTIFIRDVNFKIQTKASLSSSIFGGVIGILMAIKGLGVWSLVGQQLAQQFVNTIFLFIFSHWKPIFEFSNDSFKYLFGFGSKLLLSGLINTIFGNISTLIIGRCYSSSQLGQYTRASQFSSIFSSNLTNVVQRVSYPVMSSIQNEGDRLRNSYRRMIKVSMLVTFTCMLWLFAISKPLIVILIGSKWLIASHYLQIICFSGMIYPLQAINLNILQVKGRSDLFLKLEILKKCFAIIPILLGIFFNIDSMLYGYIFVSFVSYYINSYYSIDLLQYSILNQIRDILPSFVISIIVSCIMFSFSYIHISNYIILPLQLLIGLIISLSIYEKIKLDEYIELKQILIKLIHNT